jgi:hypothetical protein
MVSRLYTVGDLSTLSCSPDDGHNDARNMFSPIKTSSFLHLVGYFFTFRINNASSDNTVLFVCVGYDPADYEENFFSFIFM